MVELDAEIESNPPGFSVSDFGNFAGVKPTSKETNTISLLHTLKLFSNLTYFVKNGDVFSFPNHYP